MCFLHVLSKQCRLRYRVNTVGWGQDLQKICCTWLVSRNKTSEDKSEVSPEQSQLTLTFSVFTQLDGH